MIRVNDLPILVYDEFYSEQEYKLMWQELLFLKSKMQTQDQDNPLLKKNSGLLLDEIYPNRNISDILRCTRKIFDSTFIEKCKQQHYFFEQLGSSTRDQVKVNHYDNGDEYKRHNDLGTITCVTFFCDKVKMFEGGNLIFDNNIIECVANRIVLFPSILMHEVDKIKGTGRYSVTHFIA